MKKYLVIVSLAVAGFSCRSDVDHNYTAHYVYLNNCSTDVTIKSSSPFGDGWRDSIFMIRCGESHKLTFHAMGGFVEPLRWGGQGLYEDSTIVTNGEKRIIYRILENREIYFKQYYELVSQNEFDRVYRFTFTDADFEHAEPVNP